MSRPPPHTFLMTAILLRELKEKQKTIEGALFASTALQEFEALLQEYEDCLSDQRELRELAVDVAFQKTDGNDARIEHVQQTFRLLGWAGRRAGLPLGFDNTLYDEEWWTRMIRYNGFAWDRRLRSFVTSREIGPSNERLPSANGSDGVEVEPVQDQDGRV